MIPVPVVRAKDASPLAVAQAFEAQARAASWGPMGPIGGLPMITIPITVQPPKVAGGSRQSSPKPWCPSFVSITGVAATYGNIIPDKDGGKMMLEPRTFTSAILDGEIFCTINHREDLRLASRMDGSLRLWETPSGLHFELNPFATADARRLDLYGMARRGEFVGASIWYGLGHQRRSPMGVRRVSSAEWLIEVSLIAPPATPRDKHTWVKVERSRAS